MLGFHNLLPLWVAYPQIRRNVGSVGLAGSTAVGNEQRPREVKSTCGLDRDPVAHLEREGIN
jgi:hypothetical protein